MKDCRRSSSVLPPRHHIKRVSWYARYADVLLFGQDTLLSHSAKENETLFQQALYFGLKIFVARDENSNRGVGNSTSVSNHNADDHHRRGTSTRNLTTSSPRVSFSRQHLNNSSAFRGAGMLAKAAAEKERAMERDLQIVEILLLQLTGIDGVVTSTPEIAIEAKEKLLLKGPTMNQVEQLFHTWHSRGNDSKQTMLTRKQSVDGEIPGDEDEDYMGASVYDEGDDILDDRELALEMTRQYVEHGVRHPPSSSFVLLRPLQPKRGDQVLGRNHQRQSTFPPVDGSGTATNGLRSIGTFRTAFERSHTVRTPPHCETGAVWRLAGGDSGKDDALRGPEAVLGQIPVATPRGMRPPCQHVSTGNLR
ncbi:hypothetical protein FI667_g15137, partial [Globisporangium splendens]